MKFGLYYSQELDWHEPHGGGYNRTQPDLKGYLYKTNVGPDGLGRFPVPAINILKKIGKLS